MSNYVTFPNQDVGQSLSKEQMLALYRNMLTIRRCEEQLVKLYAAGKIYGGCHTYIGEEAVATGVCAHLRPDDVVFSTHRGHGHALSKGVPPRELIAELLGRATGCSGGRGGSMHLFKPEIGMLGSAALSGRASFGGRRLVIPSSCSRLIGSAWRSLVMGRRTMVRSMKESTWQPFGGCRSCLCVKITCTRPKWLLPRRPRTPAWPREPRLMACRGSR